MWLFNHLKWTLFSQTRHAFLFVDLFVRNSLHTLWMILSGFCHKILVLSFIVNLYWRSPILSAIGCTFANVYFSIFLFLNYFFTRRTMKVSINCSMILMTHDSKPSCQLNETVPSQILLLVFTKSCNFILCKYYKDMRLLVNIEMKKLYINT
jgi:hypothetical protein